MIRVALGTSHLKQVILFLTCTMWNMVIIVIWPLFRKMPVNQKPLNRIGIFWYHFTPRKLLYLMVSDYIWSNLVHTEYYLYYIHCIRVVVCQFWKFNKNMNYFFPHWLSRFFFFFFFGGGGHLVLMALFFWGGGANGMRISCNDGGGWEYIGCFSEKIP